ncbi:MAG: nitrophenyl compound nitroreductase subunit ArsF family protein [Kiritimatiellia bacterium]
MTNTERIKLWTSRFLLGFILVTIGFAAGRRTAPAPPPANTVQREEAADKVIVYAAHMTFRCPECTQIEWLARELIDAEFAAEQADGRLEFRTVDYMRDTAFARKYNISSSTIVVVRVEDGEEQDFQRLDEVWTKTRDREEYFAYVRSAIRKSLDNLESEQDA